MGTYGTYERVGGRPALRFERRLARPVDAVWRALTEPSELAGWFPQAVAFEALTVGADVHFTFPGDAAPSDTGRIVDVAAPHLLAFTWHGDILTFELESVDDGDGTLLRFTHMIGELAAAARTMAGWHVCLDRLAGDAPAEWRALYDSYIERGVPHGAPIPQ